MILQLLLPLLYGVYFVSSGNFYAFSGDRDRLVEFLGVSEHVAAGGIP